MNILWFFCSVNIKAESSDPSSSWRSLIPVIKVNISTVSLRISYKLVFQGKMKEKMFSFREKKITK